MNDVGLVSDPIFEQHDTGPDHPERPERLACLREALADRGYDERMTRVDPVAATDEMLLRLHDRAYVRRVADACSRGDRFIDSYDVAIGTESDRIARLAAGSVTELCRRVQVGELARGFAAVRPPGHHAERDLAMGFCLYGSVAIAARELRARHGVERVLICDWDVHHGNGTQHLLEDDPSVFYFSVHQSPLYPGTGMAGERGVGAGEGATLNCPLPPGAGDDAFLSALSDDLVAAADRFRPQFVIVSAGFDAHQADPLAQLEVSTEAFAEATRVLRGIADRHAGGRLVSTLEGGYDLEALVASTLTHLDVLLE